MSAVGSFFASIDPGPALKSVGKTIESGVREIGKGFESVGREVGKIGEAAIQNPVGTIAKVAAVATGQAWALPLISATEVVANGGNLEQAVKAGAISYAASAFASSISNSLNNAFANELTSSVGDASLVSTNTLTDGTIQHVFSDGSTILQGVNGALSTTPATIAPSVMSQLASQLPTSVLSSINTALANAGGSAAMTALQGGNLSDILTSGASAGVGSFAGTQTSTQLKELGLNRKISDVLGRTAGAATAGAVQGQDAGQIFNTALVNNIVRTSLAEAGDALKNTEVAKGLTKTLNEAVQPFRDTLSSAKQAFLDQAKKLTELKTEADKTAEQLISESTAVKGEAETYGRDVLQPAESRAQSAYSTARSSFDQYKSKSDEFAELVRKYDAAKAANDINLANQYADQANALIPAVNSATERYNADYNAYELAKNDFEAKNQTYLGYVNRLNNLNERYTAVFKPVETQLAVVNQNAEQFNSTADQMQALLNEKAAEVNEAYTKASEYSSIAKSTFEDIFGETGDLTKASNLSQQVNALPENNQQMYEFAKGFGLKTEDALRFAPDLSKMSVVAQQAFYDSLSENPDATSALNKATQINALDKAQQDSFFNARIQGLDARQAYDVASTVGRASKEQQELYIESVKSGLGSPLAAIFAAAQGFTGPKTRLESELDKNLSQFSTQQGRDAYRYYLNAQFSAPEALAMAKGLEQSFLSQGTGTQSAGTSGAYLAPIKTEFGDTHYWDKDKNQWVPVPEAGTPTGGIGGGSGLGVGVSGNIQQGPLTEDEINRYKAEGVSDQDIQKLVDKYGVGSAPTQNTDYYQSLIDRIFTAPQTKAKTLATTPSSGTTTGSTTTGGTTTGSTTTGGTTTGGTTTGGSSTGTSTTGGATAGTTTGGTTTGGTTTGGTTGSATTGGTTTGGTTTGGAGGTQTGGTGTGGTGTGGTGTGGTGIGGAGLGFGIGGIGGGGFAIPGGYGILSQDATGGIKNLTAGLTERMDYNLAGLPSDEDGVNPLFNAPQIIPQQMAAGGATDSSGNTGVGSSSISPSLSPSLTKAQINYILTGMPDFLQQKAEGGQIEGHNPQFYSEGGLSSIENRYVKGEGDGTSDSVPALLADGEFVIPADVVSSLGNGSNDAGASVLDQFLRVIREHKRKADAKNLPEDSKGPLAYLIDAQRRAKA